MDALIKLAHRERVGMSAARPQQAGGVLFELVLGAALMAFVITASYRLKAVTEPDYAGAEILATQMMQAATEQARMIQGSVAAPWSSNNLADIQQIAVNAWQLGISFNACAQTPLCANEYAADGYPIHNTQGGYYEMSTRNLTQQSWGGKLFWRGAAPGITGLCSPMWLNNVPNEVNVQSPGDSAASITSHAPTHIVCGMFGNPQWAAFPMTWLASYFNSIRGSWTVPYFQTNANGIVTQPSGSYRGPGYINPIQIPSNTGYVAVFDQTSHGIANQPVNGVMAFQNVLGNGFAPMSLWRNAATTTMYTYTLSQIGPNTNPAPSVVSIQVSDPAGWQATQMTSKALIGKPVTVASGSLSTLPLQYFEPMIITAKTVLMNGIVFKTWRDPAQTTTYGCSSGYSGSVTVVTQAIHALVADNTQASGIRQADTSQVIGSSGQCIPNTATFTTGCSYGVGACAVTMTVSFDANGNPVNPLGSMTYQVAAPAGCTYANLAACTFTDATTSAVCQASVGWPTATCGGNAVPATSYSYVNGVFTATWDGAPGGTITITGYSPIQNPQQMTTFQGIQVDGSLATTGQQLYGTVPVYQCTTLNSCQQTNVTVGVGPTGITNGSGTALSAGSPANYWAPSSAQVSSQVLSDISGGQAGTNTGSLQYQTGYINLVPY